MKPEKKYITINDNQKKIKKLLRELVVQPRVKAHEWSNLTKQSPALKIGYIGQYLASLILGMNGSRSAARGKDIVDGTEVKTCYKVDQADECKDCGNRVMRLETECPACGSFNILRRNDSKWLFNVRNKTELENLENTNRILLTLFDFPNFDRNDYSDIRIESFEIYPKNMRMIHFKTMLERHYYQSYLPKIEAKKKANPMNLHPHSLDFYLCNPIKVFSAFIKDVDSPTYKIDIKEYVEPSVDRTSLPSVNMPISILYKYEKKALLGKLGVEVTEVNESQRKFIKPRPYKPFEEKKTYKAK